MHSLLVAALAIVTAQAEPSGEEPQLTMAELQERLKLLETRIEQGEESARQRASKVRVAGHVDVGLFVPIGNGGAGVVQDFGNRAFPQYGGQYGWVFYGDLLAPMVNSRGEAADLGDLPGVDRFDSVHSRGAPGFLVNEAHLRIEAGLSSQVLAQIGINLVPRSAGQEFAWGDFMHVDIAQLEWMPFESGRTSVFVGKFESVFGIEYRERRAPTRFGITPSLIQRYTSGTPIGIKVRTKFLPDDLLVVALAVTNGTSVIETFHFGSEIDSNAAKTVSGRVSLNPHLPGGVELEAGFSGLFGAQDLSRLSTKNIWFIGVDGRATWRDLSVKVQWMRGFSPGSAVERVYGLALHGGGYVEANYMILPWLGVLARGEFRDAFVVLADERAYLTKSWRATGGLRIVPSQYLTIKAEYLHNGEYGGVPNFTNDVFTSSFLFTY